MEVGGGRGCWMKRGAWEEMKGRGITIEKCVKIKMKDNMSQWTWLTQEN